MGRKGALGCGVGAIKSMFKGVDRKVLKEFGNVKRVNEEFTSKRVCVRMLNTRSLDLKESKVNFMDRE